MEPGRHPLHFVSGLAIIITFSESLRCGRATVTTDRARRANPTPNPPDRLCGYPPFYDESDAQLFEMIMKGKFEFDDRYWGEISEDAKNLIVNMLQVDPVARYDTEQVRAQLIANADRFGLVGHPRTPVAGLCVRSTCLLSLTARPPTHTQVLEHPWITGKVERPTVNLSKSISLNLKKTFGDKGE